MILSGDQNILAVERTLLATMMLRPADCAGLKITAEAFLSEQHAEVFQEVEGLQANSQPVDPVSMSDHFDRANRKSLANLVMDIGSDSYTTAVPESFANRVMSAWRTRKAQEIGRELASSKDPGAADDAITALMNLHAVESRHEWTSKEAVNAAYKKIVEIHASGGKLPGVTTGMGEIDDVTGGLHAGDLIIVAARPAMGKTAFLNKLKRSAARAKAQVGFISGEQPVEQIVLRDFAAIGRVDAKKFRRADFKEEDWPRITNAIGESVELPILYLDRSAPTIAEIARIARRWKHKHGMKVLFIDYLQRIEGGEGDKKHERVESIARALKNLARDLGICVVVLAQVNREVEKRSNPRPGMGDISDSSGAEKEADSVWLLFRPGYYDDDAPQDECEVIFDKNRHGPTGTVTVKWEGPFMDFSDPQSYPEWVD